MSPGLLLVAVVGRVLRLKVAAAMVVVVVMVEVEVGGRVLEMVVEVVALQGALGLGNMGIHWNW
jgi:hypothetical protein